MHVCMGKCMHFLNATTNWVKLFFLRKVTTNFFLILYYFSLKKLALPTYHKKYIVNFLSIKGLK